MRAAFLAFLLLQPFNLLAHGGGLNSEGCHTNRKTGDYHCHRAPRTSAPTKNSSAKQDCGTKRYCNQMSSCDEAKHYLNNCGVTRLDGDGDGVPCESICGSR
jgi:hypothetical protein